MFIGGLFYRLLFLTLLSRALANEDKYNQPYGDVLPKKYFIELKDDTVNATQVLLDAMRDHNLTQDDIRIDRVITHKFLIAISIEIIEEERETLILDAIMNDASTQSISPISVIKPVDFYSPEVEYRTPIKSIHDLTAEQIDFVSPHRLSQVDRAHNELNLTGEGLFIGIIDSGINDDTTCFTPCSHFRYFFRRGLHSSCFGRRIWRRL